MVKRFRTLQSLLWDSDDTCDPSALRDEWFGKHERRSSTVLDSQPRVLACGTDKCTQLEEENTKLRQIIATLQSRLRKVAGDDGGYRKVAARGTNRYLCPASKVDPWYWLHYIDPSVASLPRMVEDIVPSLESTNFCNGAVKFNVHHGDSAVAASTVLAHCQSVIEGFYSRHPAVFKIGLTKSPVPRWNNGTYGYACDSYDKWTGMVVLFVHSEALPAGLVESALIQHFKSVPGCRNVNQGGEGVSKDCPGPYFTYVVYRVLTPPPRAK